MLLFIRFHEGDSKNPGCQLQVKILTCNCIIKFSSILHGTLGYLSANLSLPILCHRLLVYMWDCAIWEA